MASRLSLMPAKTIEMACFKILQSLHALRQRAVQKALWCSCVRQRPETSDNQVYAKSSRECRTAKKDSIHFTQTQTWKSLNAKLLSVSVASSMSLYLAGERQAVEELQSPAGREGQDWSSTCEAEWGDRCAAGENPPPDIFLAGWKSLQIILHS